MQYEPLEMAEKRVYNGGQTNEGTKNMELTANYHTHTFRCGHAGGTDREYIETAIAAGYKMLGFSDHTPMVFDTDHRSGFRMPLSQAEEYFTTLTDLKKEYRDDIEIHIGVEAEYYPATHGRFMEFMRQYPCEYMLLGQHFLLREEDGHYAMSPYRDPAMLKAYYKNILDGIKTGDFLYVAHPDLFNFIGKPKDYDRVIRAFLKEIKALGVPLEINRLGYADRRIYPNPRFWRLAGEAGVTAVVGVDAHHPRHLTDTAAIQGCFRIAEENGLCVRQEFEQWR